ncbi:carboxymuconolactone decarboxylase family protein [Nocardia sp. NPDC050697]|uniref:carboxymuconolactone decarboxylase family protein n=1 Tax=Nocardia sp. NPDC050697 TaxID=3155158 RepID=UPI0033FDE1E4
MRGSRCFTHGGPRPVGRTRRPLPAECARRAGPSPRTRGGLARLPRQAARRAALEAGSRELLILRVAWRTRSRYEWDQHVRIAGRLGVSDEQIAAVGRGPRAEIWSPLERLLISATDQLLEDQRIDDATWTGLAEPTTTAG